MTAVSAEKLKPPVTKNLRGGEAERRARLLVRRLEAAWDELLELQRAATA